MAANVKKESNCLLKIADFGFIFVIEIWNQKQEIDWLVGITRSVDRVIRREMLS